MKYRSLLKTAFLFLGFFVHLNAGANSTVLDHTFYEYRKAWLELGKPLFSENQVIYDQAVLRISHYQSQRNSERTIFIPVTVKTLSRISSTEYIDLKGQTLAHFFDAASSYGDFVSVSPGFIDPEDAGKVYFIYSDRSLVETVPIQSILNSIL